MRHRSRRRRAEEARDRAELARSHAEDELGRTRAAYDQALADGGVVLLQQVSADVDGFHVSMSMAQVLGWDPLSFLSPGVLRSMVHPDDLSTFAVVFPSPGQSPNPQLPPMPGIDLTGTASTPITPQSQRVDDELIVRFRTAHGAWARVQVRAAAHSPAGAVPHGSLIDVTVDEQTRMPWRRFAEMVERDPAACVVLEFVDPDDPATLVLRAANRAARAMLRFEDAAVDGIPIGEVLGTASAQLVRSAAFDVSRTGEAITAERLSFAEVHGTYLDLRVDRLMDATIGLVLSDVTATVALEDRLRHQASHDALTSLPNRVLFEERLAVAVAEVGPDAPVALILVDIDRLRDINEGYGLQLGDHLLMEIGHRLVREVRGTSIVSRTDGDEFAVLTEPCSSAAEAIERAAAVSAVLDRPFDVQGHLIDVSASVGVVIAPDHAADHRTALRLAQGALGMAKTDERRFAVHRSETPSGSIHRLALLSELRQGLANRDLELRYQPVVDLRSGRVTRVESVLRWRDDQDGTRMPLEFLELAEHSGLIQPLTRWILGEAAAATRRLAHDGDQLVVSTDLSFRNLSDPDLLTFLSLLISSGELSPDALQLEVGEIELMDDPIRAVETLTQLRELGLAVIVDDFGTGYTSLSTICQLPIAGLKIDRSFVANVSSVPADAAIVRSTIDVCHELGLSVGADGVGDANILSTLVGFGCDHAQGGHLSGPVPLEQLPERIAELESAVRGWIGTTESAVG